MRGVTMTTATKKVKDDYDKHLELSGKKQDERYITNKEGIAQTQVIQELDDGTIRLYELVEFDDIYFTNPNGKYPDRKTDSPIRTLKLSGKYQDIKH